MDAVSWWLLSSLEPYTSMIMLQHHSLQAASEPAKACVDAIVGVDPVCFGLCTYQMFTQQHVKVGSEDNGGKPFV